MSLVAPEIEIEVVKSTKPANFPFVVEFKPTENWGTHKASVSMANAKAMAVELKQKYPKLPVRIKHYTGGFVVIDQLPVWRQAQPKEAPHDQALWTGTMPPPAIGSRINIKLNNVGPATVTGYVVSDGYLGVMARADEETRPKWHKDHNPDNKPGMAFGCEIALLA